MFTGLIREIGTITETAARNGGLSIRVSCALRPEDMTIGASIACSGACLTVTESGKGFFTAELSKETLECTAAHHWKKGAALNLEPAMRVGESLGGHLVTGHVDGRARLLKIVPTGDSHILELEAPEKIKKFIAPKGSVTLDGVSLTVNEVENTRFKVNIIAHTRHATTLGTCKAGNDLNLEIDLIARYVARLLSEK